MKKQTKLALALSPIMMVLTGVAGAGTCTGPCNVSSAGDPEIYLTNTAVGGLDWEIETNDFGAKLVFGSLNGSLEPFVIERAGSGNTLYVGSGGNVGINNNTPFAPIDIKSTLPRIFMRDTTATTGKSARVTVNEDKLLLEDDSGTDQFVMELTGTGTTNQLYLDASGAVGIQKANPSSGAALEVGGGGNVLLENGTKDWVLNTNSNSLWFRNGDNIIVDASAPVRFDNDAPNYSLTVADSGNVGLGVFTASASLQIQKVDAAILVENINGTTAKRYLLEMKNNGATGFQLTDTSNSKSWQFAQTGSGGFTASQIGSGGPEFTVTNEGRVRMGPGSITNFDLQTSGDLVIANGSVTANGILLTSSRASKTDIDVIKPAEIMEKLKKVEVAEWRYKKADKNDRHISPMAEDFYALFQLGPDNKHINPNDLASVAIIAAKELQKKTDLANAKTELLESKTVALKAQNEALQKRLASLEKLVTNLASSNELLNSSGAKVALK